MTPTQYWICTALIVMSAVVTVLYGVFVRRMERRGMAAYREAIEAGRAVNEALLLMNYGAHDEALKLMRDLHEKNERFIAEHSPD